MARFTREAPESNEAEEGANENDIKMREKKEEHVPGLSDDALKIRMENNPVFKLLENAEDVEELYRIAELWVNPSYDYH